MIAEQTLQTRLPSAIVAVHSVSHFQLREPGAVKQPVVHRAARDRSAATKQPQAASFELRLPAQSPAARIRHQVDDAADRVRAVERRPRTTQNLYPLEAHDVEFTDETVRAALSVGRVAKAQAVNQYAGVERAQPANPNACERARASLLNDAHAGRGPQRFKN